jgi:UDP-GlcNAc:undecaprenyl-phosphate GlcNAc-1-phosphate transferase
MLNVYLVTLGLAVVIGLAATLALLAASRTVRLAGLFHAARGIAERPRWGGAALLLSFAVTPFVASALSEKADEFFSPKSGDFLAFLGACALVCAIGFLDDLKVLSWRPKLLAQIAAASAVYAAGYEIAEIGLPWGPELGLGFFAPVVTVHWVVFFTNAINLVDGRDGVALGVAILAAATLAQVAANAEHPTVALLLVAIAGAGLGLLPFNLPPASVYLGDSGAYLLGFIVGSLSIRAATGPTDIVFIAVPVVALGFPILDTVLAAVRRTLDRRHPLMGDEDHIHHRLEDTGFGPRGLLAVIYAVSAFFAGGAILLHYVHVFALEMAVVAGTAIVVAATLTKLGYVLSLWNSESIIWLRRRLRWVEESPSGALEGRDQD